MDEEANKLATQATVRYALAQGYLSEEQVREALHIQSALEEAGTPAQLLAVLGNRFLSPERLPELGELYRAQLGRLQAARGETPKASPAPAPISVKLEVPQALLERSVELLRRPPADDPEALRKYLTESEHADVALPTISDRVFVSLAKKAGYPDRAELVRCRELQLEARNGGDPITLFEIVRKEKLLSARRINRFLRWSAMIQRKESAPLEDNEAPTKVADDGSKSVPKVLAPSAASFQATVERCRLCGVELDDLGVMEGRVRQTERGLQCVPCADGKPPKSPLPEYTRPTPKKKKRRIRRAMARSREFVVNRLGSDPQRAERRFTQLVAGTAGIGLVFGIGLGAVVLSTRKKPVATTVAVEGGESTTDPAADAAWNALRRADVDSAEDELLAFADAHPRDPRAVDASRFAALIEEAHLAGRRAAGAGTGVAGTLLDEARVIAKRNPAQARLLLKRVQELNRGSVGAAAEKLERRLRVRAKEAVAGIRKQAKELERTNGPAKALEYVLRTSSSRWQGLDGGAHDALVQRLVLKVDAGATLRGGERRSGEVRVIPVPPRPRVTPRRTGPEGGAGGSRTSTPPSGLGANQGVLLKLFSAYDDKARAKVAALTASIERQAGRDTAEAQAARGLQNFLLGDYPGALKELKKAGGAAGWRGRLAIARAHLFRNDYKSSLETLTEDDLSDWYGKAIRQIIKGPFAETAPLAAPALEVLSPDRRYRIVTDLGLKPGYVAGLQRKLAGIGDPAARRKIVEKERKRHPGLRELGAVMDKAYTAYDKLFAVNRESEIIPTVFVFSNRAGFDRFSEKLMSGTAESTLGYYLPYYRIFVFYNLGGNGPKGRLLSQDTMKVLLHETFHQWLHLYVDAAPHWFNEGLAEYFGISEMTTKEYRYGLLPHKTPSRLSNVRAALRGKLARPMPLDSLIQADRSAFMSPESVSTNYATAWSFVHFLASSNGGQKKLRAYYQALRRGLNREESYDAVFGKLDIEALEKEWVAYVGTLTQK